jgi:hypothetical protein
MTCKKGDLVLLSHNDVAAEWHHLCTQALSPSSVSDKALIHSNGGSNEGAAAHGAEAPPDILGDVAVHRFWRRGATAIFDVRVAYTDTPYHQGQDPHKILAKHGREKKDMYVELCLARCWIFTPLVFSVDGLQGTEASAATKRLTSRLLALPQLLLSQGGFTQPAFSTPPQGQQRRYCQKEKIVEEVIPIFLSGGCPN